MQIEVSLSRSWLSGGATSPTTRRPRRRRKPRVPVAGARGWTQPSPRWELVPRGLPGLGQRKAACPEGTHSDGPKCPLPKDAASSLLMEKNSPQGPLGCWMSDKIIGQHPDTAHLILTAKHLTSRSNFILGSKQLHS